MQHVIIVLHLMIVLAMIGFVLLQKSEGGGLGIGNTGGFLSSRGTSNVLTRSTAFLAAAFFGTSLLLSVLAGLHRTPTSIMQTGNPTQQQPAGGGATPPIGGSGGGLLDQLRQQEGAPAAPGGPRVPQSQ